MAATHSNVTAEFILEDKSESNSHHKSQNCCLQMDTHIQTLLNDVKSLHEIVNILSEEWRQYCDKEDVRLDGGQYVDKLKSKDSFSCKCEIIKPQVLEAQKELSSLITRTNINKEELKCMRQVSNSSAKQNVKQNAKQRNTATLLSTPNVTHYTIPTENRFTILYNHPDVQINEATYPSNQEEFLRSHPKTSKHQYRSFNQKKISQSSTTNLKHYNSNQQVDARNEDPINFIPTIMNGIASNTTTKNETTLKNSETASAVIGDMIQKVITDLRESINVQLKMKNHSLKHQIILIGDSNLRGYACSLQTLLDIEYNIYGVVKPGSSSKELLSYC